MDISHLYSRIQRFYLIMLSLLPLTACHDEDHPVPTPPDAARRTVLVYMCAQNSLGASRYHRSDSLEIMAGRTYIDPHDRLIIYVDDESAPRIMEVSAGCPTPTLLHTWSEDLCSADPATFQEVLTWVRTHCPSEEYGLVMWSHASGWIPSSNKSYSPPSISTYSFGIDVGDDGRMSSDRDRDGNTGPQMDITDMAQAIDAAGIHFRYILFDACLMQNVESDYTLRHATDYIVAAPMAISAYGGDYTHLIRSGLFSPTVEDIVTTYHADVVHPQNAGKYDDYGIVISCVRTDCLDELATTISQLLPRSVLAGDAPVSMDTVQYYHPYTSSYFYRPHQYDLRCTMRSWLTAEDMARFDEVLSRVITRRAATSRFWCGPSGWSYIDVDTLNYCGLAAFVPRPIYTTRASYCLQGDLNQAFRQTEWYRAAGWQGWDDRLLRE